MYFLLSGHNMMLFHVPRNVSAYIQCGSKTACEKKEHLGDFAAWHSCPVCAYRFNDTVGKVHLNLLRSLIN